MAAPRVVLLLSGKRKSGKDFVADELRSRYRAGRDSAWGVGGEDTGCADSTGGQEGRDLDERSRCPSRLPLSHRLGPDVCTILRLSGPLKEQYAKVPRPWRALSHPAELCQDTAEPCQDTAELCRPTLTPY